MSARTGAALEIRKLRKKLRQIETLERIDRDLSDEELLKITKKQSLREKLLELLATSNENEDSFTASTKSDTSSKLTCSYEQSTENPLPRADLTNIEVTLISHEDDKEDEIVDVDDIDEEENRDDARATKNETVIETKDGDDSLNFSNSSSKKLDVTPREPLRKSMQPASSTQHSSQVPRHAEPSTTISTSKSPSQDGVNKKDKPGNDPWRSRVFSVFTLEGHNDLITATDIRGTTLVTASRDTTIRTWDVLNRNEIRSYGCHTGSVTCVILLSEDEAGKMGEYVNNETGGSLIISGSTDCSFKIWSEKSGQILRSTYTYNPITKLLYHPVADAIITSSDGGKIEVWSVESGESIQSLRAFDDCVTGLQVHQKLVYASCSSGVIKVFDTRDRQLACIFESENIQAKGGGVLTERHIHGLYAQDNMIYYGDDGVNVKVLNWKTGLVHKLANHTEDYGITDCIYRHNNILLSSAYSIDSGLGYVNVRDSKEENYLATLNDTDTERIISLSCTTLKDGSVVIVTAGVQLKVWIYTPKLQKTKDDYYMKSSYHAKLSKSAQDSDVESDADSSQSDAEDEGIDQSGQRRGSTSPNSAKGWTSWCNII